MHCLVWGHLCNQRNESKSQYTIMKNEPIKHQSRVTSDTEQACGSTYLKFCIYDPKDVQMCV